MVKLVDSVQEVYCKNNSKLKKKSPVEIVSESINIELLFPGEHRHLSSQFFQAMNFRDFALFLFRK